MGTAAETTHKTTQSLASLVSDAAAQFFGKALPSALTARPANVAAAPPPAKDASQRLGVFEMSEQCLGKGGYARVMLGRNTTTNAMVAVKILDSQLPPGTTDRSATSEAAVVREVAALRRAGAHPNVCSLHGYFRGDGHTHALVLDLARGGELYKLVERHGALPEERCRALFLGIVRGLEHLHGVGIAHRDLKLENILLGGERHDTPMIADLGLAHVHARGPGGGGFSSERLSQCCGSRSYCPPEVISRAGYDGYAADVWSLGVCLFGLASGFFPVDEASARDWRYERLSRAQHEAPWQSTTHTIYAFYGRRAPLSPALVALIDAMLQIDPARRVSLADVAASPWLRGETWVPAPAAAAPPEPTTPPRTPAAAAAAAAAHGHVDVSDAATPRADAVLSDVDASGGVVYRGLSGGPEIAEGALPPSLCRQRAQSRYSLTAEWGA